MPIHSSMFNKCQLKRFIQTNTHTHDGVISQVIHFYSIQWIAIIMWREVFSNTCVYVWLVNISDIDDRNMRERTETRHEDMTKLIWTNFCLHLLQKTHHHREKRLKFQKNRGWFGSDCPIIVCFVSIWLDLTGNLFEIDFNWWKFFFVVLAGTCGNLIKMDKIFFCWFDCGIFETWYEYCLLNWYEITTREIFKQMT